MLKPVLVVSNYKITGAESFNLESLVGINLPLMNPILQVWNRTPTACSLVTSAVKSLSLTGQTDPDFNGILTSIPFPAFTLAMGTGSSVILPGPLLPATSGQTTTLSLTNAGPAAQVWVTIALQGFIESSIGPDAMTVINI